LLVHLLRKITGLFPNNDNLKEVFEQISVTETLKTQSQLVTSNDEAWYCRWK
jgi:hypothetical protein